MWDDAPMTVSKLDAVTAAAVDLARAAAEEAAEAAGDFGVGDFLGVTAEGERLVTHAFAVPPPCLHRLALGGDARPCDPRQGAHGQRSRVAAERFRIDGPGLDPLGGANRS